MSWEYAKKLYCILATILASAKIDFHTKQRPTYLMTIKPDDIQVKELKRK